MDNTDQEGIRIVTDETPGLDGKYITMRIQVQSITLGNTKVWPTIVNLQKR